MQELIQHFHFIRPWWFLALIPALLCIIALWFGQKQNRHLARIFNPRFLPFLLDQAQIKRKRWPILGISMLWLVSIFALAGPAWEKVPQPVERNTDSLVIVWDMSPSMLTEDIKPSRLERSRLKLIDLLKSRADGQIALVAYAGEAHTVTPLTDDYQTIINLLPALSPSTLPSAGSNPEMALTQAKELLKQAGINKGDILFLTDAIAPSSFDTLASELRPTSHRLFIWGVGSAEGAPIPLPNGGFARTDTGEIVIAKLNEDELQQFTSRVGGYYVPLETRDDDIATLTQLLEPLTQQTTRSERTFDQWFEHGQYLPLLLLPFIALFFRKGVIFSVLLMVGVGSFTPRQAQALDWDRLWLNQDQRAQKRLEQGEADAARQFSDPERRGAALYRNQAFLDAAEEFARGQSAEDAYNRGNALSHAGEFEKAIEAYDQALELDPEFDKARDNRSVAQQLAELERQQQEQEKQESDDESQEQQDQDEQGDEQQDQQNQQNGDEGDDQNSSPKDENSDSPEGEESDKQDGKSSEEEMSDEQAQKQRDEEQAPEDNPYSEQEQEQQEAIARENLEDTTEPEQESAQADMQMSESQSEEEQMLEQWLRKVPDDPSGLMRNKFKYQHMQRQRQFNTPSPYSDNQAERRW